MLAEAGVEEVAEAVAEEVHAEDSDADRQAREREAESPGRDAAVGGIMDAAKGGRDAGRASSEARGADDPS